MSNLFINGKIIKVVKINENSFALVTDTGDNVTVTASQLRELKVSPSLITEGKELIFG